MVRPSISLPVTQPWGLKRGLLVNPQGQRFINEDTYAGRLGHAFLTRQDGRVFMVHSDETFAVNIAGYTPRWVAETAAELEAWAARQEGELSAPLCDAFVREAADAYAARGLLGAGERAPV